MVDDEVIEPCANGQPKEETKKRKTEEVPAWTTDIAAEPSAGHTRALGAWELAPMSIQPGQDHPEVGFPPELQGLVAMANQAARAKKGDLIWFSWNPHLKKGFKNQPSSGSQLME